MCIYIYLSTIHSKTDPGAFVQARLLCLCPCPSFPCDLCRYGSLEGETRDHPLWHRAADFPSNGKFFEKGCR